MRLSKTKVLSVCIIGLFIGTAINTATAQNDYLEAEEFLKQDDFNFNNKITLKDLEDSIDIIADKSDVSHYKSAHFDFLVDRLYHMIDELKIDGADDHTRLEDIVSVLSINDNNSEIYTNCEILSKGFGKIFYPFESVTRGIIPIGLWSYPDGGCITAISTEEINKIYDEPHGCFIIGFSGTFEIIPIEPPRGNLLCSGHALFCICWSIEEQEQPSNHPPYPVYDIYPSSFEKNVGATDVTVSWKCNNDPDGDDICFDLYFSDNLDYVLESNPNVKKEVARDKTKPRTEIKVGYQGYLKYNATYYWKVVVRDGETQSGEDNIFHFVTEDGVNLPPVAPYNPFPPDGEENVGKEIVLQWNCNDPEGLPLRYDIYFHDWDPTPDADDIKAQDWNISNEFPVSDFSSILITKDTPYYWFIVAKDVRGATNVSETWEFKTGLFLNPTQNKGMTYCIKDKNKINILSHSLKEVKTLFGHQRIKYEKQYAKFDNSYPNIHFNQEPLIGQEDIVTLSYSPVHHDPIVIEGNNDFTFENGVSNGSGTSKDPYIIENWDITASNSTGIKINDTTAYFIIRNCFIHDGYSGFNDGIYLYNAKNLQIINNTCNSNMFSIDLHNVTNSQIINNTCNSNFNALFFENVTNSQITNNICKNNYYGIHLSKVENLQIMNNICHNNKIFGIDILGNIVNMLNNSVSNSSYGVFLTESSEITIDNCVIEKSIMGIDIRYSSDIEISNTTLKDNGDAIVLFHSSDNNILDCNIFYNRKVGILVMFSNNNIIKRCQCHSNGFFGILLYEKSHSNTICHNNIQFNMNGFSILNSQMNTINNNTISNNEYFGIVAYFCSVDARYNWWGSLYGPSGRGNGDGDTVDWILGNVDLFPWLLSPPQ